MRPWIIGSVTLVADQVTKALVTSSFTPGESLPLIPHVLHLTYVQNTGAAFGLFKGQQGLFIVVSAVVIAWMIAQLARGSTRTWSTRWGCALILGGAVGNVIDRLRFGYVIDFLDLRVWPVFNVGDSAITVGVTLLLVHALFDSKRQATSDK